MAKTTDSKKSKTPKSSSTTEPKEKRTRSKKVVEPVVEPEVVEDEQVEAAAVEVEKPAKKTRKPRAKEPKEPKETEEGEAVEGEGSEEAGESVPVHDRLKTVLENLKQFHDAVRSFVTETRRELSHISTQAAKESKDNLRALARASGRKRKPLSEEDRAKRAQNGFAKPIKISEALCEFLGVSHGTEMARTAVTKEISKYVRENNLADKENGRRFHPDSKLKALLGKARFPVQKGGSENGYTYFNLQTYMKPHFEQAVAATS